MTSGQYGNSYVFVVYFLVLEVTRPSIHNNINSLAIPTSNSTTDLIHIIYTFVVVAA